MNYVAPKYHSAVERQWSSKICFQIENTCKIIWKWKSCEINLLRVISTVVKYDTPNLILSHFGWKLEQFRGKGGHKHRIQTSITTPKKKSKFKNVCPKSYSWPDLFQIIEVIQCQSCLPANTNMPFNTNELWYHKIILNAPEYHYYELTAWFKTTMFSLLLLKQFLVMLMLGPWAVPWLVKTLPFWNWKAFVLTFFF